VINQKNQRDVNHDMKGFPANLLMALAWFFRSFERPASAARTERD
jgi:hypothetical protein